jgi:hypothetical protein
MATVDEDLTQLETDIRRLKIEYEQYFGGGRQRPPTDTQWRVETMIKRYSDRAAEINFGQRFRYNNLSQTYAKYQEMWRKKTAQKESGTQQHHFGAAARAIEAERARLKGAGPNSNAPITVSPSDAARAASENAARQVFAMSLENPDGQKDRVEELYRKLLEIRENTGEQSGAPSLKAFEKFVKKKTQELKEKGCNEVEYVVSVEDGKVKLKARMAT